MCYFVHILNLSAKAILWQSDAFKSKEGTVLKKAKQALIELIKGVDLKGD